MDEMKHTDFQPLEENQKPYTDWWLYTLVGIAVILLAASAAVVIDLLVWPPESGEAAQIPTATQPSPLLASAGTPTQPASEPEDRINVSSGQGAANPDGLAIEQAASCVPPSNWILYVVQEGNTLESLAQRYGTDTKTLAQVNCLKTRTLFANQRLYVPAAEEPPTAVALVVMTLTPTHTPHPDASETPRLEPTSTATSIPPSPEPQPPATSAPTPTPPSVSYTASPEAPDADSLGSALARVTDTPALPEAILPTPPPPPTGRTQFRINIPNRYLNIVLLGSDKRPRSGAWRTDAMIIASVDVEERIVRLISIPRDLWVNIPGHGYSRVNTAELWGELAQKGQGPERVKQTIYHNLGIPIHYYARVDMQGFVKIVDTLGGIDIDVDCPLSDLGLQAGMHHMDGEQALLYARSRKSTSDFDRGRRQRKVLMALWDQTLTPEIIPRIPELWISMADAFSTDIPLDQVINLAYVGVQIKPQYILSRAIDARHVQGWRTPQGASVLLPREDKVRSLLEGFYDPIDRATLDAAGGVPVEVLNGSSRRDADRLAATNLCWAGYTAKGKGTADRRDYGQTQILVYNGDPVSGAQVAGELRVPVTAVQDRTGLGESSNPGNPPAIRVILGADYNPCQR
jgi:LCP family protein required for cell wall assembly